MKHGRLVPVIRVLCLTLLALTFLLPVWMMFVSAFRQTNRILSYPPVLWPSDGSLNNFRELFAMQDGAFFRWFLNSVLVCGGNTVLMLILSTMASYAFAKREFPGKKLLFPAIIGTQMIPQVATLIPLYLIVSRLGWNNTYAGLILPDIASAFGVFLMTQFMRDIPDSLLEAARIDGAGEYGIFARIVLPVVVPSLSLLAIFNFTQKWGALTWPLIVTSSVSMRTLPLGIACMKDLTSNVSGPIMAASLASFLPVLVAFLFARDQFMAGMMLGAVKG